MLHLFVSTVCQMVMKLRSFVVRYQILMGCWWTSSSILVSRQLMSVKHRTQSFYLIVDHLPTTEPAPTGEPSPTTPAATPSITVSITPTGTNTAGETYSLTCSATVTGSTSRPTFTWLDPTDNTVPSEMITTCGSVSTLTFDPLAASYTGTYTCTAAVAENAMTDTKVVSVRSKWSKPVL